MKYTIERVMQGIIDYADAEVMGKLPTSGKWVMGTVIGMASHKARTVADSLKENPIISMLDIIDENDMIEVEDLLDALKTSADRYGNLTLEVPMVGRMTFTSSDVDHLRNYIV